MKKKKRTKECYDRKSKARSINIGDPVFVKTHEIRIHILMWPRELINCTAVNHVFLQPVDTPAVR